jgi:hypothetical protein
MTRGNHYAHWGVFAHGLYDRSSYAIDRCNGAGWRPYAPPAQSYATLLSDHVFETKEDARRFLVLLALGGDQP